MLQRRRKNSQPKKEPGRESAGCTALEHARAAPAGERNERRHRRCRKRDEVARRERSSSTTGRAERPRRPLRCNESRRDPLQRSGRRGRTARPVVEDDRSRRDSEGAQDGYERQCPHR
jgi:hypothetical protein